MIVLQGITTVEGTVTDLVIESEQEMLLSASGLTVLPAVIDPHVHFRTPGLEHKEDWTTGARAAVRGGCTMVFDMPNTKPPTVTAQLLQAKKTLIDQQLAQAGIPLRYQLFFGADKHHLNEIAKVRHDSIGIKVFMGCSTGNLVIDDDESLNAVFALAAQENMLVAVHAEDEQMLRQRKPNVLDPTNYAAHSEIRNVEAAAVAVTKAIELSKRYGVKLYILHVSSAEEIDLIRQAKAEGLSVYAETSPHHLFFDTNAYKKLGGCAVVNPPLREKRHQASLVEAIHDGTIDTIGSDHAPHLLGEKQLPYGQCPSGMPGIEFMLPLLLNAYHQHIFSLKEIVSLTSERARDIFKLPDDNDVVIVDLDKTAIVSSTYSKCQWSPYEGLSLRGWPVYTILKGHCFQLD